ncbi:CHAT domain-containing protein [Aphanothece sacrum]|uniref:Tetratricopeptide repeat domain protein n=1 Tax=Aphanothece sacrum FPU1 TaxID=1920663 RepID=A0A401IBJ8_APHSA|nr:CHAT domain-containing protein [Aphanothece sacrum]GBF78622.1 tetratricopeptide repeat domain protein [Aphanothece sacrum FPU1]GBF84867.1 tetratricopeptide repeat protein [Aphanothece sacrum FPU3]
MNLIKKLYGRRSLILLVLLFLISLVVPLFVAQVSVSTPIVQTQQDALQLIQQGRTLYQAKQFVEAATIWQQAADVFATRGDKLNQAMALSNLSLTYQQLGQWNEAKIAISQSISILQTLENTPIQQGIFAAILDIKGQLQLVLGESANALNIWQQATKTYEKIGNNKGVIQSKINQAQAMQKLGLYPRACKTLLETLEIDSQDCQISEKELEQFPENISISLQILGLRSLGNVLRVTGQTKQSQIVLLKSWQLAQTIEDPENLAEIALSLGNTTRVLGNQIIARNKKQLSVDSLPSANCITSENYQTNKQFYQQAIACYHQAELGTLSITKIQAQLNLLSLFIQLKEWNQVPIFVNKIKSELTDLPSSRMAITAQLKLAQNLMCIQSTLNPNKNQLVTPILQSCPIFQKTTKIVNLKELQSLQIPSWQAINQLIETAINQAQNLGDKQAQANSLGYLGATYQERGNFTKAQQLTEQALQQISAFNNPELTYLWQWQLGRLYQLQGKTKEAIASYTLAVDMLESLRRDLVVANADIQFNFRDSVEPVYRELVDQLLQPSPNQPGEISQEKLKKARDVIESLQLAELNNFFREACIDAQAQQIDQVDPQAAVIYSIVLPKRLAVILSLPGKPLSYYQTTLTEDTVLVNEPTNNAVSGEVERIFDDMFANLNPYISNIDPLRPHQQLYDWLIRPLEAELAQNKIKTLVFVLDGVLRGVPMAALHDGQQYLIEKYNVALTPGLQLLTARSLSRQQLKILAGGIAEARQGFSALPGVKEEVKEISQLVSTEVLLDQDFTSDRLQKEIETTTFRVVHLATHGQFSSQVEDTFLLTWDERINVKNLDQLLKEREGQKQSPIELLILSACQTATGDKRAVLGLAGVAVRSGARSTLATLWSVQDQSTVDLMSQFYKTLNQSGVSKAEALRQAQLSLLHSAQYQHPFYWASFVLVGNWL